MNYKTIQVKFIFDEEEWENIRKHCSESDLRQLLYEGALGELGQLLQNREEN